MRILHAFSVLLPIVVLAPASASARLGAEPDCALTGTLCTDGVRGGAILNERDGAFIRFLLRNRPSIYDNLRDRDGDKNIREPQLRRKDRNPSTAFA